MRSFGLRLSGLILALGASSSVYGQAPPEWVDRVRSWVSANQPRIVDELVQLLSIPNVAADRANIRRNAEHLRTMLQNRGFTSELLETAGNPLVYGELKAAGAKRTLLLYFGYRYPNPSSPGSAVVFGGSQLGPQSVVRCPGISQVDSISPAYPPAAPR